MQTVQILYFPCLGHVLQKTSVRCQWGCTLTLQSLCHSSCLAENQTSWVIALSRTSADSNKWAALALTTRAQILHDWLPFWWTWALSPTAHKLEPSLKTVFIVYWHEDIDFYCIWPIKCIIILPTIDWKILQMSSLSSCKCLNVILPKRVHGVQGSGAT